MISCIICVCMCGSVSVGVRACVRVFAFNLCMLVMVAVCNRADHYIFILFLSSSFFFFLLLSFFPRLISAVGDWLFTILWHMVWP